MAQADQAETTDSRIDTQKSDDTLPSPIVLEASGPATLVRRFGEGRASPQSDDSQSRHEFDDGDACGTIETETVVDISIEFETRAEVYTAFFNDRVGGYEVVKGMKYAPRVTLKDIVDTHLEDMDCHVSRGMWQDSWDVELVGSVESWLAVLDEDSLKDVVTSAETLAHHHVTDGGVSLALGELRRQRGETMFDDDN